MARYEDIDASPWCLPVALAQQLLPGTFVHAAHHRRTHKIDRSSFGARFRNDDAGGSADPPAMLLTVVLRAYGYGVRSSRGIERLCGEHARSIALCGDTARYSTTIDAFVCTLGEDMAHVFAAAVTARGYRA